MRKIKETDLWLPSLVGRICLFLFFGLMIALLFFVLGSYQAFLDSTLLLLLNILNFSSLIFLISAFFYLFLLLFVFFRSGALRKLFLVLSVSGILVVAAVFLVVQFITSLL